MRTATTCLAASLALLALAYRFEHSAPAAFALLHLLALVLHLLAGLLAYRHTCQRRAWRRLLAQCRTAHQHPANRLPIFAQ